MKSFVLMSVLMFVCVSMGQTANYQFNSEHLLVVPSEECVKNMPDNVLSVYYDAVDGMDIMDVRPIMLRGSKSKWQLVGRVVLDGGVWRFIYVGRPSNTKKPPKISSSVTFRDAMWFTNREGKDDSVEATFSFVGAGPAYWTSKKEIGELGWQDDVDSISNKVSEVKRSGDSDERDDEENMKPTITKVVETLPNGMLVQKVGWRRFLLSNPKIEILPNGMAVVTEKGRRYRVNPETGETVNGNFPLLKTPIIKREQVKLLDEADIFVARFDSTNAGCDICSRIVEVVTSTGQSPIERREIIEPLLDGQRRIWEFAFKIINREQFACQVRIHNYSEPDTFVLLEMVPGAGSRLEKSVELGE